MVQLTLIVQLKNVLQRELHGSRSAAPRSLHVADDPGGGLVVIAVGNHEIRVVHNVEHLPPCLDAAPLRQAEILKQRCVRVEHSGAVQDVAAGISRHVRQKTVLVRRAVRAAGAFGGGHKRPRIVPGIIQSAPALARYVRARRKPIGPVELAQVRIDTGILDGEWLSRVSSERTGKLPVPESAGGKLRGAVQEPFAAAERQWIVEYRGE